MAKVKVYKNPNRIAETNTQQKYVPQHKLMGVEPKDFPSAKVLPNGFSNPKKISSEEKTTNVPSVGNQEAWMGFESDEALDPTTKIVDNNELGSTNLYSVIGDLAEDNYLLLVRDMLVASGDMAEVERQTRQLVFGEHPLFLQESISLDYISVVKKVKIKIGLFLE